MRYVDLTSPLINTPRAIAMYTNPKARYPPVKMTPEMKLIIN